MAGVGKAIAELVGGGTASVLGASND